MSYDANGNMTGKTAGSANWTYAWDFENRMTSASDGVDTASYVFDALGRRIKRTKGTDIAKFTHDGQDVRATKEWGQAFNIAIFFEDPEGGVRHC